MSPALKKPTLQKFFVEDNRPGSGWSCVVRAKTEKGALQAAARKYARQRIRETQLGQVRDCPVSVK